MNNKDRANQIFAMNPKEPKVFMTTDGQGFFDEHKGEDHQRKLGNGKKLETFKFEDSEFGKQVIAKTGVNAEIVTGDETTLEDLSFDGLKALATDKGISLTGLNSKKKLIAAISSKDAVETANAAKAQGTGDSEEE